MHWTYPIPIEMEGTRNIYTVHDLVPLRLPHTTLDHKKRYLKMVKMIGRRADHIVTVSETSKSDIVRIMGLRDEQVTNTYQAVDFGAQGLRSDAQARSDVSGAVGLPHQGYFLFFGAIEPKKNVGRLIEGFLTANVKTPLLLVGKAAWKSEQELRLMPLAERRRAAAEAGPERWSVRQGLAAGAPRAVAERGEASVMRLDYVPYSMLISLIRGAKAVVFPSIYEGFGLPVLEAMQLGVPVITSNTSSLPEVAGDAALLVDPYDPRAIGEAVRRLDGDAGLRDDLSRRGLQQAARFSPEFYRARLGELYGRLGVALP
jgi:glycosyltransferase involved in cell wall biosynthesis